MNGKPRLDGSMVGPWTAVSGVMRASTPPFYFFRKFRNYDVCHAVDGTHDRRPNFARRSPTGFDSASPSPHDLLWHNSELEINEDVN